MKKLSDLDKNLKVRHLGGKPVTLTISHVGIKSEKKKSEIQTIAGGALPDEYEETAVLFWKEHGSKFPLVLNATNREFIIGALGDTEKWAPALIGRVVTLERKVHPAFKKEYVGITAINNPPTAKTVAPQATTTVNKGTGEITENSPTVATSTTFWERADALNMKGEASKILESHTVTSPTGKTTNWQAALVELNAVAGDQVPA